MAEPRKVTQTVSLGGRGKSQREIDAQMLRIQGAIWDNYSATEPFGRGTRLYLTPRGNELYRRAQMAYNNYSQNIASAVNPGVPDYESLWLNTEQRNRRVPMSVYTRNNRR